MIIAAGFLFAPLTAALSLSATRQSSYNFSILFCHLDCKLSVNNLCYFYFSYRLPSFLVYWYVLISYKCYHLSNYFLWKLLNANLKTIIYYVITHSGTQTDCQSRCETSTVGRVSLLFWSTTWVILLFLQTLLFLSFFERISSVNWFNARVTVICQIS